VSGFTRSTACNLEQVANLYCVLRPVQLPTVSGTGTVFIYCEVWDKGRVSMIGDNGVFVW